MTAVSSPRSGPYIAATAGLLVATIGATVLVGWVTGIEALTRFAPSWARMTALTALAFLALGSLLWNEARAALRDPDGWIGKSRPPSSGVLAGIAIAAGAVGLATRAAGYAIRLERLAIEELPADGVFAPTATMAPAVALCLMLLGSALLGAHARRPIAHQVLALVSLTIGWLGVSRVLYGGEPLFPYTVMAFHAALSIMIASVGVIALRTDFGIAAIFERSRIGSLTARRFVPAAVFVPLIAGGLAVHATHARWLGTEASVALFALSVTVIFVAIAWIDAAALERTERRSREARLALRTSEEKVRTLTELLPQLVWTCRADGWCDYLSRQWVEYTGIPEQEQIGFAWANQIHPDDRDRVQAEWDATVRRGDVFDVEFRIRRADGAYRWFKTRALPLRDDDGNIVKWFGSNTDFEDLKSSEERLLTQLQRFNLLDQTTRALAERQDLDSILGVVLQSIEDRLQIDFGAVLIYNEAARELHVASVGAKSSASAQQAGMLPGTQIGTDDNELASCLRGELIYEPDIASVAFTVPRQLHGAGLRALVLAPLIVENATAGILVAARRAPASFTSADCEFLRLLSQHVALAARHARLYGALQGAYDELRETQHAVMQQERLRALGQMASGIAHDINNALSPAMLYAQILRERDPSLSDHARQTMSLIQSSIQDVAQTVARMREFYRPSERQRELQPVDINAAIGHVVDLTRARWQDMPQERGIVIRVATELAENLPRVMGAENEIKDAITNLILNAIDAMPNGGTLTVRTRYSPAGNGSSAVHSQGTVQVDVSDTGIGMDDKAKSRCLEPFFTTKGDRGTGLGLAMVYGMIQRHQGTIDIESAPGVGTTMRLGFHILALSGETAQTSLPLVQLRPLRILMVDDDPLILQACQIVLQADGHTVKTAEGGQAGIAAFLHSLRHGSPFDVVFTDLGMPYVDGRQVAAAVKAASPATPVILMTGWGTRLRDDEDVPEHVDFTLSKPPVLAQMRAALAHFFAPERANASAAHESRTG